MKLNIIKTLSSFVILFTIASCEDNGYKEYTQETTPSVAMNGEWFIDISEEATGDVLEQHILHKTYDTNGGDNKMYIDNNIENTEAYFLKVITNVDISNLTFNTTNADNLSDPSSTFNITEGKIIKNAAHSLDGNVTDSIYFKGEFSYDPGNIIIFSGHKRTGFLEDEF